jgi:hypothetical protein
MPLDPYRINCFVLAQKHAAVALPLLVLLVAHRVMPVP